MLAKAFAFFTLPALFLNKHLECSRARSVFLIFFELFFSSKRKQNKVVAWYHRSGITFSSFSRLKVFILLQWHMESIVRRKEASSRTSSKTFIRWMSSKSWQRWWMNTRITVKPARTKWWIETHYWPFLVMLVWPHHWSKLQAFMPRARKQIKPTYMCSSTSQKKATIPR